MDIRGSFGQYPQYSLLCNSFRTCCDQIGNKVVDAFLDHEIFDDRHDDEDLIDDVPVRQKER